MAKDHNMPRYIPHKQARMHARTHTAAEMLKASPIYIYILPFNMGAPPWSSGSVLDHRSLPPVFESRRGHIWRSFRLSLRLITFGVRSAHLAYLVHKSGRETSIIIILPFNIKFSQMSDLFNFNVCRCRKRLFCFNIFVFCLLVHVINHMCLKILFIWSLF